MLASLPIMLAVRGRSLSAKIARDQADQAYYESKQRYYHGVKLHLLGAKQYHSRTTRKGGFHGCKVMMQAKAAF